MADTKMFSKKAKIAMFFTTLFIVSALLFVLLRGGSGIANELPINTVGEAQSDDVSTEELVEEEEPEIIPPVVDTDNDGTAEEVPIKEVDDRGGGQ